MSKKLENLLTFQIVWDNLLQAEYERSIKGIAIEKFVAERISAIDAMVYAVESVINRHVHEEQERIKAEKENFLDDQLNKIE